MHAACNGMAHSTAQQYRGCSQPKREASDVPLLQIKKVETCDAVHELAEVVKVCTVCQLKSRFECLPELVRVNRHMLLCVQVSVRERCAANVRVSILRGAGRKGHCLWLRCTVQDAPPTQDGSSASTCGSSDACRCRPLPAPPRRSNAAASTAKGNICRGLHFVGDRMRLRQVAAPGGTMKVFTRCRHVWPQAPLGAEPESPGIRPSTASHPLTAI